MSSSALAKYGVASQPAFVITYGPSKMGKTVDDLYSFPCAFYVATPAALKPAENVVGFSLHPSQVREVNRISDATKILLNLPKEFDSMVFDDFSLAAERTLAVLEKSKSGYKLWGALRDEVLEFRDASRSCGKHVVLNCHEQPPQIKGGKALRGGPKLPSDLPEALPAQCDLVLRAFPEPTRAQTSPWPVVYRCTPTDPTFITGDRHGVTPDMAPMNIGEILRQASFRLKRAPGLEWMEDIVAVAAKGIEDAMLQRHPQQLTPSQVRQNVAGHLYQNVTQNMLHIRWALRDASDRATLRIERARMVMQGFFT